MSSPGVVSLLEHTLPLALVAARMLGLFMTAPMLNSFLLPQRAKVLLGVSLAFASYPVVGPSAQVAASDLDLFALAPMLAMEAFVGYAIGLIGSLPLVLVQLAGYLMGYQMGLSLAQVFNPNVDIAADLPGQLLFLLALGAFLAIDGPEALFLSVLLTFQGAPPGTLLASQAPMELLLSVVSSGFDMALRVAAPVVGLIMLVEISLAFLMRTIPQINVLTVGFGLKILIGIAVLALAAVVVGETIAQHVSGVLRDTIAWSRIVEGAGA